MTGWDVLSYIGGGVATIAAVWLILQCVNDRRPAVRGADGRWRAAPRRHSSRPR